MLSVTTYLSTDIASVPLLWIVPLTLYLLSFVVGFASRGPLLTSLVRRALPILLLPFILAMGLRLSTPAWLIVPMHLVVFFALALVLHGELARRRPGTRHLTAFYLWMALGGVCGGLFNTLLAPVLFSGVAEYPIALVLACTLLPWAASSGDWRTTRSDVLAPLAAGIATGGLVLAFRAQAGIGVTALLLGAIVTCYAACTGRRQRFALAVALSLVIAQAFRVSDGERLYAERTFFGVHRVDAKGGYHKLSHGTTLHGQQSLDPARRRQALSYYGHSGPVGQVFDGLGSRLDGARVATIGLGAGSLAAFARPGQQWTFYEIDPAVVRIARDPKLFTYLSDCGHACAVVLGDARISLARAHLERYDVLILDAFSSDAIPVHLLTREAVALYLSRLVDPGVLVFHISNRHLDLRPPVAAVATDLGLVSLFQANRVLDSTSGEFSSQWVVMARSARALGSLVNDPRWTRAAARGRAWTDDFSNILSVLKWK